MSHKRKREEEDSDKGGQETEDVNQEADSEHEDTDMDKPLMDVGPNVTLELISNYVMMRFSGPQHQREFRAFLRGLVDFVDESRELLSLCVSSMKDAFAKYIGIHARPASLPLGITQLITSYHGGTYEQFYVCKRGRNVDWSVQTSSLVWKLYTTLQTGTRDDIIETISTAIDHAHDPGYSIVHIQSLNDMKRDLDSLLEKGISIGLFEAIWI